MKNSFIRKSRDFVKTTAGFPECKDKISDVRAEEASNNIPKICGKIGVIINPRINQNRNSFTFDLSSADSKKKKIDTPRNSIAVAYISSRRYIM